MTMEDLPAYHGGSDRGSKEDEDPSKVLFPLLEEEPKSDFDVAKDGEEDTITVCVESMPIALQSCHN